MDSYLSEKFVSLLTKLIICMLFRENSHYKKHIAMKEFEPNKQYFVSCSHSICMFKRCFL